MDSSAVVVLNAVSLAVIGFSSHVLVLRSLNRQVYLPLAFCLLAIGVVICQPVVSSLFPQARKFQLVFSLPALLLIAPTLWLYVQGLTSESRWRWSRSAVMPLIPAILGSVIALIAMLLPDNIQHGLLVEGSDGVLSELPALWRNTLYAILITTFILVLSWVVQSGYYLVRIFIRLNRYRARLKDVFASTGSRELHWLSGLIVVIGVVWALVALNVVMDNLLFPTTLNGVAIQTIVLVMVWSIGLWGLRQKPGFEALYADSQAHETIEAAEKSAPEKYQRSALDTDSAQRIANKMQQAVEQDKLFLDPALSLQKLARHIHVSPNYISQTLNETLGMNFFDYINQHRVEAAKERLCSSGDTILDIALAVGFNAKSSFYAAFKKHTQLTPSAYRKQHRSQ
ncbi:AraC family transcriptional regulator [Aestuariibacter halophilus]|uniref:AraC family transcriptional regulator n=1 Tax=Fluctibacter halophilus TaxID=226011 RepID=A0ABS8GDC7_9ALTE|nr:AraC family transcriptional regulator [Aestuariibacter halophilus]MCC2617799.1 AraC family transcriptional regulator [Aestuariibacter halophilus]